MYKQFPFVASMLSLLAGGLLYIGFRPISLLMFKWLDYVGLDELVADFRAFSIPYGSHLPEWLLFSAPNGLWIFSFAGLMVFLWGVERLLVVLAWTFALWFVGVTSEILQSVNFLSGVFDIGDVFAYTIGFFGVFLFRIRRRWINPNYLP